MVEVLADVITTSASQRTEYTLRCSTKKARDEGGRDEDCRLRSTCKTTKHCHGGHGNRRVHRENTLPRGECRTSVLRIPGRSSGGRHRSHWRDAVVLGVAGRVGVRGSGRTSGEDPSARNAEAEA